jgi:BASS family bile acid:Na+ symporter
MARTIFLGLVQYVVFALLLSVGLRTTVAHIKEALQHRSMITRTVLVTNVVVPLMTMVLVAILPMAPVVRGILLIMAISPGAPFLVSKFKADANLPPILLALISMLAVVTAPLWAVIIGRLFHTPFEVPPALILKITLGKVVLPLLLGLAIRQYLPRVATPLGRAADIFYKVVALVVVALLVVKVGPALLKANPLAILAVVVTTLASTLVGHWAGGPDRDDRRVVASFAALGNPGLAGAIIAYSFPNVKAGMLLAAYLIIRAVVLLPYNLWMRRKPHGPATRHPSPPTTAPRPAAA